jgi:hypothetical protein
LKAILIEPAICAAMPPAPLAEPPGSVVTVWPGLESSCAGRVPHRVDFFWPEEAGTLAWLSGEKEAQVGSNSRWPCCEVGRRRDALHDADKGHPALLAHLASPNGGKGRRKKA